METELSTHINEQLDSVVATKNFLVAPLTEDNGMFMVYTYDLQVVLRIFETGEVETHVHGKTSKIKVTTLTQYAKFVNDFCNELASIPYSGAIVSELRDLLG